MIDKSCLFLLNLLSAIIVCSVSILILSVVLRNRLKRRTALLIRKMDCLPTFCEVLKVGNETNATSESVKKQNVDIRSDLESAFYGEIITARQKEKFIRYYLPYYEEGVTLLKKYSIFKVSSLQTISNFIRDFENIHKFVEDHNNQVIGLLLERHKEFFDSCLKYPLDAQQRRSIVSEEDNCLVVSSAGSGKTSSIIGKVKYLTEVKGVDPQKILLISYTNKAAAELTERMDTNGLKGYTFHKLAIDIIGKASGVKPSICDKTDALFVEIFHKLLEEPGFSKSVVEYFINYQDFETEWEQHKSARREQLTEQKNLNIKALLPDMDGRTIYVRSYQEQKICFALSALGVKFRYEEPYECQLADEMHSQYCPDFSIHFERGGVARRVYLEHFGINERGLVPAWFAKDKNLSYEQANQLYNDGIAWKKAAHKKYGTQLLITTSADFKDTDIKDKLRTLLKSAGIPIHEKSEDELFSLILPKNSKREKAFVRLVSTFVTLLKSSCKSIDKILLQAENALDHRSVFAIKNIFLPVYKCYEQALRERQQIDFTDAILQATEICENSSIVEYEYIIVDEFQDISVDRYNFLKVLREGKTPAKLYCVGDDWQSIYRFSGSDVALFNRFSDYFGATEINKIETTYRFGEPLVALSSRFIQRNSAQIQKDIHPFNMNANTDLEFCPYERQAYCNAIENIISSIPLDKSVFLLGRYSFDDYYLSFMYPLVKEVDKFFYVICGRKIEFLTVHKSKGLEADYVILLQCNKDTYGFPSLVNDDPVLNYVLTCSDQFPFGEERRLFYVAITRAKVKTFVLYDKRFPSVFVDEFIHPEKIIEDKTRVKHRNANKRWTYQADAYLLDLYNQGKTVKYISAKMGRSQTSIVMRLNKLKEDKRI